MWLVQALHRLITLHRTASFKTTLVRPPPSASAEPKHLLRCSTWSEHFRIPTVPSRSDASIPADPPVCLGDIHPQLTVSPPSSHPWSSGIPSTMAALNTSTHGPSINKSYQTIVDAPLPASASLSPTHAQWAVFSVQAPLANAFQPDSHQESTLRVQASGDGELADLIEEFSDGRMQFAFVKVKDANTGLPKNVMIGWVGCSSSPLPPPAPLLTNVP